jgi:phosphatidylglycerol:prolipoprotein diacylglycerol transferase
MLRYLHVREYRNQLPNIAFYGTLAYECGTRERSLYPSIQIGHLFFPTFSVVLWVAVIALIPLSLLGGKTKGLSRGTVLGALLAGVAGFAISAWLFHALLQRHATGSEMVGGCFAVVAAVKAWAVYRRVPFLSLADCLAQHLALYIAIVRVGCFMAGCDFGEPTGHSWGVTFTSGLSLAWYGTPLGVPLHPTQLYESAWCVAIFVLLSLVQRGPQPEGARFSAFVATYAFGRFFIEFLRGDADRGFLGPLSVPQWFCIIAFIGMVLFHIQGLRFTRRAPAHRQASTYR